MRLQMLQDQQSSGQQFQSSANMAAKGRGGFNGRGRGSNRDRGKGGRGSGGRSGSPTGANAGGQGTSKAGCQICDRPNHTAIECWYRFEKDFQPNNNKNAGYRRPTVLTPIGMPTVVRLIISQESWKS
jgi:hypothetical protein